MTPSPTEAADSLDQPGPSSLPEREGSGVGILPKPASIGWTPPTPSPSLSGRGERPGSSELFTSYSANFEDVILHRLFPDRRDGFYVDIGAGHPRLENDLYAFYERGWRGINVEPNEGFFALLRQLRCDDQNLCMLLSDTAEDPLTYYEVAGSGLSTCDEAQARAHAAQGHELRARILPVGTLAGILTDARPRHIDVLKVDVEGFEEKVLSGNDWERFRPTVVLVEATYPESAERRPTHIRGFMEQRGYRYVHFDGLNDFYLERSFPVPEGLTLPPNVFDRFVSHQVADLREQVASLDTSFAAAEDYTRSLLAELEKQTVANTLLTSAHDKAFQAASTLTAENRRLGLRLAQLGPENRRLRDATEQMRGEILTLSRLLEPLHAATEEMERQRGELESLREDMRLARLALLQQERETQQVRNRLQHIYASRSWWMTKPWRFIGRVLRQFAQRGKQ
jgi:FkbM family methyltransferase